MSGWTEERVERLKVLWTEGKSGAEIARELHTTRCAVIAKVHRLKLPKRDQDAARINMVRVRHPGRTLGAGALQRAKEAKPKPEKPRRVIKAPTKVNKLRLEPMPPPPPASTPLDVRAAKPWIERQFWECAHPVGGEGADTLSCCLPIGRGAYCLAHWDLMHEPTVANQNLKKATSLRGVRRAA